MKMFQLNEQVKRFTQPEDLQKLTFVVQNSKSVKFVIEGLEPMGVMYVWQNMKKNEHCLVFNENKKMLGYIALSENGVPVKYLEPEELYFSDMYQEA